MFAPIAPTSSYKWIDIQNTTSKSLRHNSGYSANVIVGTHWITHYRYWATYYNSLDTVSASTEIPFIHYYMRVVFLSSAQLCNLKCCIRMYVRKTTLHSIQLVLSTTDSSGNSMKALPTPSSSTMHHPRSIKYVFPAVNHSAQVTSEWLYKSSHDHGIISVLLQSSRFTPLSHQAHTSKGEIVQNLWM